MTHFSEADCLLYLDGQLEGSRAAELASHATSCDGCGALLRALERESRTLSHAFLEEDEPLPLRLRQALAQDAGAKSLSWAIWAWAISFGLAAATALALWAVVQPWLDQLDQAGFQTTSFLSLAFFSGAFWGGWGSMFDALQYAAMISLAVLAFGLWRPWRRQQASVAVVLLGVAFLLAAPSGARAAEIRRGPNAGVAPGETVDNDLIVTGRAVRVAGTVKGDLIAFSQDISISGHITGDVIVFAQRARISGQVDGNIRAFAQYLSLDSGPAKNVIAFARNLDMESSASVGGSMIALAAISSLQGKIARDLLLLSGDTTLDGSVGGNLDFRGQRLLIGPTAQIIGTVQATGQREPEVSAGAKLDHPVEFTFRPIRRGRFGAGTYVFRQILAYVGAFFCGLLLIKLFPGLFEAGRKAAQNIGLSLSIGALVLVCGIALVLFAFVLIVVGTGAGLATLMLLGPVLYGSQIFVGCCVGEMILKRSADAAPSAGALALGLLILRVLSNIPFLGFFVLAAILLWGTGAICMAIWERTRLTVAPAA